MMKAAWIVPLLGLVLLSQSLLYCWIYGERVFHKKGAAARELALRAACHDLETRSINLTDFARSAIEERCAFLLDTAASLPKEVEKCDLKLDKALFKLTSNLEDFVFFLTARKEIYGRVKKVKRGLRKVLVAARKERSVCATKRINAVNKIRKSLREDLESLSMYGKSCVSSTRYLVCDGSRLARLKGVPAGGGDGAGAPGLGARLALASHCLAAALASNRSLVMDAGNFLLDGGAVVAVAGNCSKLAIRAANVTLWPSSNVTDGDPVERLAPPADLSSDSYDFGRYNASMPPHIPSKYRPKELRRVLDDPLAWYLGELTRHLTTPTKRTAKINRAAAESLTLNGTTPVVGLQLGKKSSFRRHFVVAEELFKQVDLGDSKKPIRRVAIASTSSSVVQEARSVYPSYKIFDAGAGAAARLAMTGADEVLVEIALMAKLDFFVGLCSTFVGRAVYQLRAAADPLNHSVNTKCLEMDWHDPYWQHQVGYWTTAEHAAATEEEDGVGELSFSNGEAIAGVKAQQLGRLGIGPVIVPDGTAFGRRKMETKEGTAHELGTFPKFKVRLNLKDLYQ